MLETVTQSMLGMWHRCPAQFERRYILDEIYPPGIAARRGGACHKAAAVNHEQKKTTRQDMPVADLQDAARDHYVHLIKERGVFIPKDQVSEKGKLLAEGLDAATRLTALYRTDLAPKIQPVLVEEKLIVEVGLELPIAGIIDVFTEDNWLPDLKSAAKSPTEGTADKSLQLTLYAGLIADKTGKWPGKVSLEYLVNTKEPKLVSQSTTRGPQDWANLMARVQVFLASISTGLFPPCAPDNWACGPEYCGYWWTCRWGGGK